MEVKISNHYDLKSSNSQRVCFIDHLKIALIILVIAHHAGQAYGTGGWWYYLEGDTIDWLGTFFSVNASFFMSLFFFLSAYFLPASIEKKGTKLFLRERLYRLGLPIVIGFLTIIPILMYFYYVNFRDYPSISFFSYYINIYFGLGEMPPNWTGPSWPDMQFGHLWFLQHLLLYSLFAVIWQKLFSLKPLKQLKVSGIHILCFVIALTLVTFAVRIGHPIDSWVGFLGIIQTEFARVPQYVLFFSLGIFANRTNLVVNFSTRLGLVLLGLGGALTILLYTKGTDIYYNLLDRGELISLLTWTLVDTVLCVAFVIGFVVFFREKVNRVNRYTKLLSQNVYVVYFLHVPIVVFLQNLFSSVSIPTVLKFICVTFLGVFISFTISHFVWRRIPYLKNIM